MSLDNLHAEMTGGETFDKCPNCGSERLEDFRTQGVAGHQAVHCRDCGKSYKRRGAIENYTDAKMEDLKAWSVQRGRANRAFVYRNPMVLVVAMAWMIFPSLWIGISINPGVTGVRYVWGVFIASVFGALMLAMPGVVTLWFVRRYQAAAAGRAPYGFADVWRQDQRWVAGIAAIGLALTLWRFL